MGNDNINEEIRSKFPKTDLDLEYITPRMIAMSFPCKEISNDIEELADYLNKNYTNHYLIYNVSGKPYSKGKFYNKVVEYNWTDHRAPPLYDLIKIYLHIKEFLNIDESNIVLVHCLAGKERTGTVCSCSLILSKIIKNTEQAINYFCYKRYKEVFYPVLQPSQLRYVDYCTQMIANSDFKLKFKSFIIKDINLKGIPLKLNETITKIIETNYYHKDDSDLYLIDDGYFVLGDFIIYIGKNDKLFSWVVLNTAFMDENEDKIILTVEEVDPKKLLKTSDFKNLRVEITYKLVDLNSLKFSKKKLIQNMINEETEKLNKINSTLENIHNINETDYLTQTTKTFFGKEPSDIQEILDKIKE